MSGNPEIRKLIREVHNIAVEEVAQLCDALEKDCRKQEAAGDELAKLAYGVAGDTARKLAEGARALKMEQP